MYAGRVLMAIITFAYIVQPWSKFGPPQQRSITHAPLPAPDQQYQQPAPRPEHRESQGNEQHFLIDITVDANEAE